MNKVTIERFPSADGQSVVFLAHKHGEAIGRAEVVINHESAFLKDISVTRTTSGWCWFPPFYNRGVNYRGKGVGRALLASVFGYCIFLGVEELTGVMHGNLELLTHWYQKNGFEILEGRKIRRYFRT